MGQPFGVAHEHRARYSIPLYAPKGPRAMGVAKDKLIWYVGDMTSNIWLMQLPAK